ncbi:MAG: 50S ribosomal protein L11 methyltransferase, partial [Actinomycetota bacterium]|nr:50S ribosomal protein L11 methyltransferase [Actinomycetota bacterium]
RDEDLSALSGEYDVIVANILAPTLIELAPTLAGLLSPRGRIVLSGILDSQVSEVVKAHGELAELARTSEDQWVCVVVGHR